MFAAEQHALDVHCLHPVPLGFGDLVGESGRTGDAGIVDQHVQAAELGGSGVDGALHRRLVADVHVPVAGARAAGPERGGDGFALGVVQVEQGDRAAFIGQAFGAGAADAERGARDDADLASDPVHGAPPSMRWRHSAPAPGRPL